jgi:hypothetical protein
MIRNSCGTRFCPLTCPNVGNPSITYQLRNEFNAQLGIGHSVTIRIENADAHSERAKARGARIT